MGHVQLRIFVVNKPRKSCWFSNTEPVIWSLLIYIFWWASAPHHKITNSHLRIWRTHGIFQNNSEAGSTGRIGIYKTHIYSAICLVSILNHSWLKTGEYRERYYLNLDLNQNHSITSWNTDLFPQSYFTKLKIMNLNFQSNIKDFLGSFFASGKERKIELH